MYENQITHRKSKGFTGYRSANQLTVMNIHKNVTAIILLFNTAQSLPVQFAKLTVQFGFGLSSSVFVVLGLVYMSNTKYVHV